MKPLISVIVPTFNRSRTIARTLNSILLQTYDNFEIIVVEDGSQDETMEILNSYNDRRLRIIKHDRNLGVTAAKNTGLNNILGEWFTILDSDDEIIPNALEMMIKIPLEQDSEISAVICNCVEIPTGNFTGIGLLCDQYVDFKTMIVDCQGEFWGITKTELLFNDRFNEALCGFESTLWYKIDQRAKRYYLHKGLRLYHTEGNDRISNVKQKSVKTASIHYQALSQERNYLEVIKKHWPDRFAKDCVRAVIYLKADKQKEFACFYYRHIIKMKKYRFYKLISFLAYNSNAVIINMSIKFLQKN